nr:putative membrane protein [Streptococcus suis]
MKKISDLGLTGRKLVGEGLILVIIGIGFLIAGWQFPGLILRFIHAGLFFLALYELSMFFFRKKKSSESVIALVGKAVLFGILASLDLAVQIPLYFAAIFIGIYQLFTAVINFITFYLYKKDDVQPRIRFLMDGIWLSILGVASLFVSGTQLVVQTFIIGSYLVLYGLTNLRDGFIFEESIEQQSLKRHVRLTLPLFIAALVPRMTLQRVNDFLANNKDQTAQAVYNRHKDISVIPSLEVFVHVGEEGFGAVGHVDLSYKGRVYGYGSYDVLSERLGGAIGDGVLFKAERQAYIDFCTQEGMTMLGYQMVLSPEQEAAIEERLDEIDKLLVPWNPSSEKVSKTADGQAIEMYAFRIKEEIGAELFKFRKSKFKTYFVLSTNCVLLADSVIGQAGTDILGIRGFIAPGTYQTYLDQEYEKPHSMVVAKNIYYRKEKS